MFVPKGELLAQSIKIIGSFVFLIVFIFQRDLYAFENNKSCLKILDERSDVCTNRNISLRLLIEQSNPGACFPSAEKTLSCSRRLEIRELRDTTVSGDGINLVFSDPRPGNGGVYIKSAINVAVENFTVNWEGPFSENLKSQSHRPIFSYGMAEACNGSPSARIRIQSSLEKLPSIEAISEWNDQIGWPWHRGLGSEPVERYFLGDRALKINKGFTDCTAELRPFIGRRLLLRHYVYANNALTCRDCVGFLVKDVSVYSAPGMAFMFWGGSDIALIRNRVMPACSPSCIKEQPSVSSDASHFGAVAGSILVAENDFSMQGDDSVNVTSWVYPGILLSGNSDGGYLIRIDKRLEGRFWALTAGQSVKITDLGLKEIAKGTLAEIFPDAMMVRIQTNISTFPAKFILMPLDRIASNVKIVKNHFHRHRGRGVLVQAGRVRIEDNEIYGVTMAAVMIGVDTDFWFEGPGAESVLIKGNRIRQVNAHPYSKDYPSAISAGFVADRTYLERIGNPIGPITIEDNDISEVYGNPEKVINFGAGLCCNRN